MTYYSRALLASFHRWSIRLLVFLAATPRVVVAQTNVAQTDHSVVVTIGSAEVEVAAATAGALRLSVSYNGKPQAHRSIFLADSADQPPISGKVVHEGKLVGVATAVGELLIDPANGDWTLHDSKGGTIIPLSKIGEETKDRLGKPRVAVDVGWKSGKTPVFYGSGNGAVSLLETQGLSRVGNGVAVVPHYWSDAGYAVLAVGEDDNAPASWKISVGQDHLTWRLPGSSADLYLMPAATLYDAAAAYAQLSGPPVVPPRWTFGYLQCRWGWQDRAYIEDTLKQFTDRQLPVDAFIFDFEWYTTEPDYKLTPAGETNFVDFGWNPLLFPEPAAQLTNYQAQGVRVVGIRKPRLGNSETLKMIRAKGWDMPHIAGREAFEARNLNFQNPDARAWYAQQIGNLLDAGIAGWWDDEGEVTFTEYYYWNQSQSDAMAQVHPGMRSWTVTRAFQPGLQRYATATWTGDILANWEELAKTPTHLLNWSLAGMNYGTCDIGGFKGEDSPELLTRWMQAGTFFPVMRSHSRRQITPRFPWLYGPDAQVAIRKALDLRYRLVPTYYSLAHEAYRTGAPLMRPLLMEFPGDPNVANLSSQWLIGRGLMAAPVLEAGGKRSVYLPDDTWYIFDTSSTLGGHRTLDVTETLDEVPVYVRAGTILPLAPVLQHTDQLPGGPLELQVYPGKNASFTMVEDDGLTTNYRKGQLRRTTFTWDDAKRRLSWDIEGPYAGKDIFKTMKVKVFDPKAKVVDCFLASSGALNVPN
jgi:alpha-glucosidase